MNEILTLNISGMDEQGYPDYEQYCQIMLRTGLSIVAKLDYEFQVDNKEHRYEVEKLLGEKHSDCSGYQMSAVMSHICYIAKHGLTAWMNDNLDRHLMVDEETLFPSDWVGVRKCGRDCVFAESFEHENETYNKVFLYCKKTNKECFIEGNLLYCYAQLKEN